MGCLKVCSHFTLFSVLGTIDLAQVQLIEIQFKAIASFFAPLLDDWVGVPKIIFFDSRLIKYQESFFFKVVLQLLCTWGRGACSFCSLFSLLLCIMHTASLHPISLSLSYNYLFHWFLLAHSVPAKLSPTYLLGQVSWFPKYFLPRSWQTKSGSLTVLWIKFYWDVAMLTYWDSLWLLSCYNGRVEELSSRKFMACKAKSKFSIWPLIWWCMNTYIPIFKFLANFISKDQKLSTQEKAIKKEGMVRC